MDIEASTKNNERVIDFVNERLEALECPVKLMTKFDIAVDELFTNIAYYAYGGAAGPCSVSVSGKPGEWASVEFRDFGIPYDPFAAEDPDVTLPIEKRREGGLGVFIVKNLMDETAYARIGAENVTTITKRFV